MRSRNVRIVLVVALAAAVVVVVVLLTRRAPEGPYALTAWNYGAIAWVEPVPEDLASVAATATGLFDDVFALWGFSPPEPIAGGRVARKGDPAGGPSVDLRALEWKGSILPPLVLIVFPDRETLREATGLETDPITLTYGIPPTVRFDEESIPIALSDWVVGLAGASVTFVCTADRWREQFVGEAAKWLLSIGMQQPDLCECVPYDVPSLVRKGFAGYTVAQLLGGGEDRLITARAWAAENEISTSLDDGLLQFDVDPATLSALGTSFIAYLLEERSRDELISAICAWRGTGRYCGSSTSRTIAYIHGWRTFLGVEE